MIEHLLSKCEVSSAKPTNHPPTHPHTKEQCGGRGGIVQVGGQILMRFSEPQRQWNFNRTCLCFMIFFAPFSSDVLDNATPCEY
jgi:hypothetical protein